MTWTVPCLTCGVVFLVFAVLFAVLKEKATPMIGGFGSLSKEEQAQYDMLKSMGCQIIQGYYFSKPLPAAEFDALIEKEVALCSKNLSSASSSSS